MRKFLAVVKREYVQRVRTKMFVVMTILGPLLLAVFTVVPGLMFTIKTGGPTRLAVVDQTEGAKLYQAVSDALVKKEVSREKVDLARTINANAKDRMEDSGRSLMGSFSVEQVSLDNQTLDDVKRELNRMVGKGDLDGYLVIPPDILKSSETNAAYYGRNVGDPFTRTQIEQRLNRAVSRQRLIENGVKEQSIDKISEPVELVTYPINEKGEEGGEDSGAGFIAVFTISFLIYLTILLYGQVILGAVIEEKETRIAEILFSSVRSFPLMIGKLIGVSLVALTQLSIWGLAFLVLSGFVVGKLIASGFPVNLPHLPPLFAAYFFLFFLLGYFIYATFYVLVGSMVTTTQEGGQVAMPIIFLLMIGFYMSFLVIRSPNSSFAFWVSMVPFFSPITMLVRIVSQTPPLWQIALSLAVGFGTVVLLIWLASRVYRVGMLMYGKKATIPEVMRWAKQS